MKNVLVLQHADCEGPGIVAGILAAANLNTKTVRGDLGESIPQELEDIAALVLMGGPMSVYEEARYPFLVHEIRLIESAVRAQIPVFPRVLSSYKRTRFLRRFNRSARRRSLDGPLQSMHDDGSLA